jgi:protein-disulfide isomerase
MATAMSAKQRAKISRSKAAKRRKSYLVFGAFGVAAFAIVAAFIAMQAFTDDATVVPPIGEGRVLGDANAPVTIVEYADFQCPSCKKAATDIVPAIEEEYINAGLVKLEYRYFPFLGQESWDAAQAAAAAEEQGKFWEYYAALYNAQGRENAGVFSYDKLLEIARDIELDVEKFDATLASNKNLPVVQADADAARDRGVSSTPTFYVGDTQIVGAQDIQKFRDAIEHELAKTGEGMQ